MSNALVWDSAHWPETGQERSLSGAIQRILNWVARFGPGYFATLQANNGSTLQVMFKGGDSWSVNFLREHDTWPQIPALVHCNLLKVVQESENWLTTDLDATASTGRRVGNLILLPFFRWSGAERVECTEFAQGVATPAQDAIAKKLTDAAAALMGREYTTERVGEALQNAGLTSETAAAVVVAATSQPTAGLWMAIDKFGLRHHPGGLASRPGPSITADIPANNRQTGWVRRIRREVDIWRAKKWTRTTYFELRNALYDGGLNPSFEGPWNGWWETGSGVVPDEALSEFVRWRLKVVKRSEFLQARIEKTLDQGQPWEVVESRNFPLTAPMAWIAEWAVPVVQTSVRHYVESLQRAIEFVFEVNETAVEIDDLGSDVVGQRGSELRSGWSFNIEVPGRFKNSFWLVIAEDEIWLDEAVVETTKRLAQMSIAAERAPLQIAFWVYDHISASSSPNGE